MKKKITFSCITLLFLLSAVSGFSSGSIDGAIGCLVLAAIFGFLAYRSFSHASSDAASQISHNSTTPPENSDNLATKSVSKASPFSVSVVTSAPEFEFVKIKVAGVTFKNDDGLSRQSILRKIKFHDEPFSEYADLELRRYDYEGAAACGVYANGLQIGNIPADKVQFIYDNWERIDSISAISVYGGGRSSDGYKISYGCEITLKLDN